MVLRLSEDQWVLVLSPDLGVEAQERVVSALFAKKLGVHAERPLVIMRRDAGFRGPHLTWCPAGCVTDHSDDVRRGTFLADLSHRIGTSAVMTLAVWDARQSAVEAPVLSGQIGVDPYCEDPERAVPHVSLQVFEDEWMECLGPQELDAVTAKVRSHLTVLEDLSERLVEARASYRGVRS
ncbi:DUF6907 domain-containing protein [Streptomyces sp. NPDC059499]|uniref:DUF6907 domain-containing protein n=1 Tax=Streptomyces sp. NPDC059499 TaxID=3346852 RepID=UPI0036B5294E